MEEKDKIRKIFNKLVEEKFFEKYKIKPFIHNVKITNLGNPSKYDWKDKYCDYVLMHGRYGNGDTIVSFKIRKNKLLIFRWDTDSSEYEGKRYLGSIIINDRLEKIKKITNGITRKNIST
jgi:hypothetical protein